jgi:hypothetical protein
MVEVVGKKGGKLLEGVYRKTDVRGQEFVIPI